MDTKDMFTDFAKQKHHLAETIGLKLGESFVTNAEVKKLLLKADNLKVPENITEPDAVKLIGRADRHLHLALFTVSLNQSFDTKRNKLLDGTKRRLFAVATSLGISEKDVQQILSFLSTDQPYTDTRNGVYLSPSHSNQLIKSKGLHIYFQGHHPHEIKYLLYFETFNCFLCRTYASNRRNSDLCDSFTTQQIDILDQQWYARLCEGLPSFRKMKELIGRFQPLQSVETAASVNYPRVVLSPEKGVIIISGVAAPLSITAFFDPIHTWVDMLTGSASHKHLKVYIRLPYFNAYTAKFLVNLVRQCDRIAGDGRNIKILWYYEKGETEIKEFGDYLKDQCSGSATFILLPTRKTIFKS